MSGALLPLKTHLNAGSSLYAPASGGGGGGGVGPNLVVSSLVVNQSGPGGGLDGQVCFFDSSGNGAYLVEGLVDTAIGNNLGALVLGNAPSNSWYVLGTGDIYVAGASVAPGSEVAPVLTSVGGGELIVKNSMNVSSITVSSINGLQYPPGQTDNFSTLSVSSIGGVGGQPMALVSDLNVDPNFQMLGGGSNASSGASINNFQTISCGTFETTSISPAYSATTIPINAPISANGISTFGTIYGNGNLKIDGNTDTGTAQIGTANITVLSTQALQVSTILRLGNPQGAFPAPASATQGLLPLGIPGTADAGSYTNMIQGGYVSQLPYLSTVLFTYPYQADNTPLCVQITPTNQGISPGQNPAISLNGGWGYAGTGVSSIGFSVDARNGGVGYAASFYWLAYPATQ